MRTRLAAAALAGLVAILTPLIAPRIKGQAQDGGVKWNVCRHGGSGKGTSWDAESARRSYRAFTAEVGKSIERVGLQRRQKLAISPQHLQGCTQSRTRVQKLSVRAGFTGGIVFASTRDTSALKRRIDGSALVVFVDYEKVEDALEAGRDLGTKWSLGSKEAAAAFGVACVPSIVTPVKSGEVRIDEINLR